MSTHPRDVANQRQLEASDPGVSAFVAASAGSGKTKLLTDRLLRLMLAGARPERIQCLTFTKAAAAEMAVRLQRTLGRWVTMSPEALARALRDLNVDPTDETCRIARSLFAKVLDLPGGMRIGTIHAFCQSLLRRFPLEAALSPHFQLVEERDAEQALADARERMLAQDDPSRQLALRRLAGLASVRAFGELVAELGKDRERLRDALALGADLVVAQRRALGVTAASVAELRMQAVTWSDEPVLRHAAQAVQAAGSPTIIERAARVLGWLSLHAMDRAENWDEWRDIFLRPDGEPRGPSVYVNKALSTKRPELLTAYVAECERIHAVEDSCRALEAASISAALVELAAPVLHAYAERKEASGLLDYDDLIERSQELLREPGAAWVLYKLDGGLDHLLLDEVQDTAPRQWAIAHALTEEFFAGEGARDVERTVFAVGDRKQSIYSFQGADADEFDRSRGILHDRLARAGKRLHQVPLNVSFRSTAPVLQLVDSVFSDPAAAAGVVAPGETLEHLADRAEHAGSVELWPLVPVPDHEAPEPWTVPHANQGLRSAVQILAENLADWIRDQTNGTVMLESRGRPLRPGDVMILVRRRNAFGHALVRALKSRGVPVAGLDRMVLTDQPAVQDLMALAGALLLPQDDLTFAAVLTSPLGGLDDDDLMALAINRGHAPLWTVLRDRAAENPRWRAAWDLFAALLERVDYVSPYALFAEALGARGGRARLLARLGAEAAEPINELLQAALTYGRSHPPSLQGFLHWLRQAGAEVKREGEAAGNLVRVLTVHGAKGLQAPLVILPDTTARPPGPGNVLWANDPESGRAVPLWLPRKEFRCIAAERVQSDVRRRQDEEYNRLLYVALTRAEDRLVVCGWETRRAQGGDTWYEMVTRGMAQLPFERMENGVLRYVAPQVAAPAGDHVTGAVAAPRPIPDWVSAANDWRPAPPPVEPPRPEPLAPSRPEGVELGTVPAAASPLAERDSAGNRFRRGQLIHALLQHLPSLPSDERAEAAYRYLSRPGHGMSEAEAALAVDETLAILVDPDLAPLFGPGSRAEVPLTGVIANSVVGGLVDRLVVLPDRVLIADFKTNRRPPPRVEDTPVMYLRQMASYRAVLQAIFPDRSVRCVLIWTREARVSVLPDALLAPHEPVADAA